MKIGNRAVLEWVDEMARLCKPDRVVWCDGSLEEKERLTAMIMRSSLHEFHAIGEFCRARTKDYYRFDPVLHLRYDRDPARNAEIQAERLTPDEIASLDLADEKRHKSLLEVRDQFNLDKPPCSFSDEGCGVFSCGIGIDQIVIGPDGSIRACQDLFHPQFVCSTSSPGSLVQNFRELVGKVRALKTTCDEFRMNCRVCSLINLCMWCPARAFLEHGELDRPVSYFCDVAHTRSKMFQPATGSATSKLTGDRTT